MDDRDSHRAAVEAGYASLAGYVDRWGEDDAPEDIARVHPLVLGTPVVSGSPNGLRDAAKIAADVFETLLDQSPEEIDWKQVRKTRDRLRLAALTVSPGVTESEWRAALEVFGVGPNTNAAATILAALQAAAEARGAGWP